jgi:TonB family protein
MNLRILCAVAVLTASSASFGQSGPVLYPVQPPPAAPAPPDPPAVSTCVILSTNESDCTRFAQPRGSVKLWVTLDDYPTRALREGLEGRVEYQLDVGLDGRPTGCEIIRSSGLTLFDETTCRLVMRRAKFYPALDKKGEPTVGTWKSEMNWLLPLVVASEETKPAGSQPTSVYGSKAPPPPIMVPAPPSQAKAGRPIGEPSSWISNSDYPPAALAAMQQGTVGFRLTYGPDGVGKKCEVISSSGYPLLDDKTCSLMLSRARFEAGVDESGEKLGGIYTSRLHWNIPKTEIFDLEKHPVPGLSVISFTVDKTGFAKDCRFISGENPEAFLYFVMPCNGDQRFPIYTDKQGNIVERPVRITIGVTLPGAQSAAPRKKKR